MTTIKCRCRCDVYEDEVLISNNDDEDAVASEDIISVDINSFTPNEVI